MVEQKTVGLAVPKSRTQVLEMSEQRLNQFRANFALVWRTWRANGEISEDEMKDGMKEAGAAVKANLKDLEWIACASAHFAGMADAIRRDTARAERIRNEVRADRARKAA